MEIIFQVILHSAYMTAVFLCSMYFTYRIIQNVENKNNIKTKLKKNYKEIYKQEQNGNI
jgi:hypothetical protein